MKQVAAVMGLATLVVGSQLALAPDVYVLGTQQQWRVAQDDVRQEESPNRRGFDRDAAGLDRSKLRGDPGRVGAAGSVVLCWFRLAEITQQLSSLPNSPE